MKVITISASAENGKDFTASILKEMLEQNNKRVIIIHYADYLKYLCKQYFNWDGNKDEKGRTILQYVGTNLVRNNNPNCWVNVVHETLMGLNTEYDFSIICDTRFPNEINLMKKYGWDLLSVHCTRLNFENSLTEEQRLHESETALNDFEFDVRLEFETGKQNVIDAINNNIILTDFMRG